MHHTHKGDMQRGKSPLARGSRKHSKKKGFFVLIFWHAILTFSGFWAHVGFTHGFEELVKGTIVVFWSKVNGLGFYECCGVCILSYNIIKKYILKNLVGFPNFWFPR